MRGSRSTAQTTNLTVGSSIIFTQSDVSTGSDILLNTLTGQITLGANKTYRLMAQVPTITAAEASSRPAFSWYNDTTSTYFGSQSSVYQASDSAAFGTSGGLSEAIITTTQTTVVTFRILSSGAGLSGLGGNPDFSIQGSYPWFDIEVISGYSPLLNGTPGTQGNQGPTGLQGTLGAQGNQGPTGLQGTEGAQGNQGPIGFQGFEGNQGITGAQGNQGPTGQQGIIGIQGTT